MEKPDELAVSTTEYTISCAASYLDTMALPELTLTLNGNAVPGTTSNIGELSFFLACHNSKPYPKTFCRISEVEISEVKITSVHTNRLRSYP